MPDSQGSELVIGRLYRSSAGNLWRVTKLLSDNRVRVVLESRGHGCGTSYVWHRSSCADLTPVGDTSCSGV